MRNTYILVMLSVFLITLYGCNSTEQSQQICKVNGGNWIEFPNEGQFCHDECNKPENNICKTMMSFGCDCGPDKCWNGNSCELN